MCFREGFVPLRSFGDEECFVTIFSLILDSLFYILDSFGLACLLCNHSDGLFGWGERSCVFVKSLFVLFRCFSETDCFVAVFSYIVDFNFLFKFPSRFVH